MLKRLLQVLFLLPIMMVSSAYAVTCQSNEFEYDGNCIESKFEITTTNDTDKFVFNMSAKGTFYIDWGDGNVEMINRTGTTMTEYSHDYANANEYIIKFGGRATGYTTVGGNSANMAAILFGNTSDFIHSNTYDNIKQISGSLGAIFPTIGNGGTSAYQPRFYTLFYKCSNLIGPIPENLFSGITGKGQGYMFRAMFSGCTSLSGTDIDDPNNPGMKYAIPPILFSGLSGAPAIYMFYAAFNGCSGLTGTIPGNLFSGIVGKSANYMFYGTFSGCSGLTGSIPGNLFSGIASMASATSTFHFTFRNCSGLTGSIPATLFSGFYNTPGASAFRGTFSGCSGLTGTDIDDPNNPGQKYAIPPTLFSGLSGRPGSHVFYETFSDCTGLAGTIPGSLFSSFSGAPQQYWFYHTFYNCSGLTGKIPGNLFGFMSGAPAQSMFSGTFYKCNGLTGSIPETLFGGVSGKPASGMFYNTFYGCSGLTGAIPGDLFAGISGAPISEMFYGTFGSCSGLTKTDIDDPNNPGMKYAIPPTLFSGISGAPATSMFARTFYACSGLAGTIPGSLFSGISGAPRGSMFSELFRNCSGLTGTIPGNLFSGISGTPAQSMFNSTFYYCSGLTGTIPSKLFGSLSGAPAESMFYSTFAECTGLSGAIPDDLFSGIIGKPKYRSFNSTFRTCANLGKNAVGGTSTYYIPPELFAGIDSTSTAGDFMTSVFYGTGLRTSCPAGTTQYITGFESLWNNKKSCTSCPVEYPDYDSTNDTCYAQVTFIDSDNNTLLKKEDVYYDAQNASGYNLPSYSPVKPDTILTNWENGSGTVIGVNDVLTGNQVVYSDWGFHCDSGHYFHIGENEQICVAESKRTEHAMVIQFDSNHLYYIHATPNSEHDYTINSSSVRKLKVDWDGTIYNLHDASVYFDD